MKELYFDDEKAWEILTRLASRGKRVPGTLEHKRAVKYLLREMKKFSSNVWLQKFSIMLAGRRVKCANICGFMEGRDKSQTILVGSHFDTRIIADNEQTESLKTKPIPGVNDGTSGVAIIIELMHIFQTKAPRANLIFVLFDAEDVGNISGHPFGVGSIQYVEKGRIIPNIAIILDMVAGVDMHLNIDINSLQMKEAERAFAEIFRIGRSMNFSCYFKNRISQIIGDHTPFIMHGIPALILIDIDYPQWHTHQDTLENCNKISLKCIGEVLVKYLS